MNNALDALREAWTVRDVSDPGAAATSTGGRVDEDETLVVGVDAADGISALSKLVDGILILP